MLGHYVQPAGVDARLKRQQDFKRTKFNARVDPVLQHKIYYY